MSAGRMLRKARGRAGLTQRQLARAAGVAQPTIAKIERGSANPRFDTLDRLLRACGERLDAVATGVTGIDRSVIRELLALSPRARLERAVADAEGLAALEAQPLRAQRHEMRWRTPDLMSRAGSDEDLIEERLRMTPRQRLDALLDALAWEERARKARRLR